MNDETADDVDFRNKLLFMLEKYLTVKVECAYPATVDVSIYFNEVYISGHQNYLPSKDY